MGPVRVRETPADSRSASIAALIPTIRRIVHARVADRTLADDLVQETMVQVLAAMGRVDPELLEPYAIATARNTVATLRRREQAFQRNEHRLADVPTQPRIEEDLLRDEEHSAVAAALQRLPEREREALLAHEVSGDDTASLALRLGTSAGAVAAQLHRARARLRVEYLLALEKVDPPEDRCRPVLFSLSLGDRRRQRELDAARHLLMCEVCARLSPPLLERSANEQDAVRVEITADADIVTARQTGRELASRLGFGPTDLTVIATAVSEVARNIVRFAGSGRILVDALDGPQIGLRVIAHDRGPGIADVDQAIQDGYSTIQGLGIGLPGARRLMDEFAIVSAPGRGTTVTMIKWRKD